MPKTEPFDTLTERYEKWFEKHKFAYLSELNVLKKIFPEGKRIEIGAGTGRFSQPLGIKVGVEPSLPMGKIAKKRGIYIIRGVAEYLPVKDRSFDICLFVTTICFVDDIKKSFKEAHRILKDRGYIVIGFIDKNTELGKFYLEHKWENPFYREATFYSTEEVINLLQKTGFKVDKIYQTIFHLLSDVKNVEPIKEGYGKGAFVAIRAKKEVA